MVAPCQATFHINLFQVSPLARKGFLVLAEECTKAYKLNDRHSIILALNHKFKLDYTKVYPMPGGGDTLLVLLYASKSAISSFPTIQSGLLVCENCAQLHHDVVCSSVETCLRTSEITHGQASQRGTAIRWGFVPSDVRPVDQRSGRLSPPSNCPFPREQSDPDCATFPKHAMMNYVVGGLNNSLMSPKGGSMFMTSPTIAWSEDGVSMERYAATTAILQIQIYPMRSDNKSRSNLKFITTDGVEYRIPSLSMYSQPFATSLWVSSLGFVIMAVMLIFVSSAETKVASRVQIIRWSGFWMYGAAIDQVQDVPRVHAPIKRVEQILFGALGLAFLLNNHYKAELNVNYVAGNELIPRWHRIDQLLNFTTLYVLMGTCTWEIAKGYSLADQDDDLLCQNQLHYRCTMGLKEYCKGVQDGVPCILNDEKEDLVTAGRGTICSSYVHFMQRNGRKLEPMTPECQKKRINVLRSLNRRLKFIPVDQLASYVRNDLTNPNTALLTTEAGFGSLWVEFEKAMKEDRRIKFSHNLFSPVDTTIANRDSRLQILSGMKAVNTRVVTNRVHNLLSTGIWDFWIDFGTWRKKLLKLDRLAVSGFAPLTMKHDGIYLLFTMMIEILLGLSAIVFTARLVYDLAVNFKVTGWLSRRLLDH